MNGLICPSCGSRSLKRLPTQKGFQYKCPNCGYEGPAVSGLR